MKASEKDQQTQFNFCWVRVKYHQMCFVPQTTLLCNMLHAPIMLVIATLKFQILLNKVRQCACWPQGKVKASEKDQQTQFNFCWVRVKYHQMCFVPQTTLLCNMLHAPIMLVIATLKFQILLNKVRQCACWPQGKDLLPLYPSCWHTTLASLKSQLLWTQLGVRNAHAWSSSRERERIRSAHERRPCLV